ncbi:FtsK/SpoIIIE family DNA translocase [Moheibacter sediminis]|uniref:DNA segregation ATPase FtsK/SpoIIIE, S-DNA-T family n=1 Tax=Moheibacter sediminis TaxID=1434700 RepID=A0A1W1ZU43_9FLAO|nr:DNA translocase FtsK [Moheibacter sediminis]SMC51742.1 DNA segregation ATPase FtsK/SpoIIIE, S-DNA-T family [Moheibacter sediminis]
MDEPKMISPKPPRKNVLKTISGVVFLALGIILLISFVSYIFHGHNDQSQLADFWSREVVAENVLGKLGAYLGELFIYHGVGITAVFLPIFFILLGIKILFKFKQIKPFKLLYNCLFFLIWTPIFLGFVSKIGILHGVMGFEINDYMNTFIGKIGMGILLGMSLILYMVINWRITPEKLASSVQRKSKGLDEDDENLEPEIKTEKQTEASISEIPKPKKITPDPIEELSLDNLNPKTELIITDFPEEKKTISPSNELIIENISTKDEDDLELTVEKIKQEDTVEKISANLVEKHGEYDPTLDLPGFKFPPLDLLRKYDSGENVTINQQELERNKNRIIETLANYGIGISQIKATIGPTVTLYEIVPEAGVRISKIKNLEDDIALSLSALGIRIIAPIPGKGTIGIEVPNSHPTMVSMRSVIASQKFQTAKMELPIAFGKTISNETFVADLAKMPHLLMAGATGQGKSVGLNAIITSLLYKKHPSELKFVMVDPKKVELTLYSKIERHYLAKLPDSDDAIITDNKKVINTLNSLCIEMDDRYELLKNAYVRNLKEYNEKFKQRKLNPENGHRYLPYIVLIVDEFADLIMTAGKEVEMPIARLAQLARAVGIHLIIATQRPSVNVITGTIKANFPARVAFRVTSKIDSRTILDSSGADQLIGKGDMLFTTGNELVRLQCAFVDTPEVDEITEYIGSQKGYPDAFLLPEYVGEDGGSAMDIDLNDRDSLFDDAARIVVMSQQGSASLLQRKLKLGYNRAGRLIDQLEAAGIVGPFEGSKARQVLIMDDMSLEQLLNNLNQN